MQIYEIFLVLRFIYLPDFKFIVKYFITTEMSNNKFKMPSDSPTPIENGEFNDVTNEAKFDLSKFFVEYDDDIPEPEPLLMLNLTLVLSRGNISTIKGKAKARKSFFITLLVKFLFEQNPDISILLIDTEQSKSFVFKAMKRAYRLMDWTDKNSRLKVLSLRECDVTDRKDILVQAINELKPDVVLLDGGVDIICDFNNAQESKEITGLLMKLSTEFNCHIVNVLHEGKTNGELRGHFGAEMLNKSETVFEVVKDDEQSLVKPYATRNQSFDEFTFMIDDRGLPVYTGVVEGKSKSDIKIDKMKMNFTKLLAPNKILDYHTLTSEYMELEGCTDRTAKSHIAKARNDLNHIRKVGKEGYCLVTINVDDE